MPAAAGLSPDLGGLGTGLVYVVVLAFVFVESGLLNGFLLPGDSVLFGAGLRTPRTAWLRRSCSGPSLSERSTGRDADAEPRRRTGSVPSVGRHRSPAPGGPLASVDHRMLAVAAAVLAIVIAAIVATVMSIESGSSPGSGTGVLGRTHRPHHGSGQASGPTPAPASTTPSPSAPVSTTPSPSAPVHTLAFEVTGTSYITVRTPAGDVLVSRLFKKGSHATFDENRLEVVVGNSGAVRFTLNGRPRRPGARGQVETFDVTRR